MKSYYERCAQEGIDTIVFGDIFLEDLRAFREQLLASSGLTAHYPLWKIDTRRMISDFINDGFRTALCAVDAQFFSASDAGRTLDDSFVEHLPAGVDPCGENGEFHTLVYDGPIFKKPFAIAMSEVVRRAYTFRKISATGNEETVERAFWFAAFT